MKVLSTAGLTKLIQLIKSAFISVNDTVTATTVELADVATTGDYEDLINTPTVVTESTVSGWGFTKNAGTVTSVNNISPINGNVTLTIAEVDNVNTSTTFYAWRQDFDATKIFYTTVPYDTSVTGFKVYDSSFKEVINNSVDENEFYQDQMWYYNEDGTGFVCTRVQAQDVVFTPIKQWIGTREQYDAIVTKDLSTYYTLIDEGKAYIGEVQLGSSNSRNIGEIVASTLPLTDAGLHLLDGSLIQGGGIYSAFVDYIADIYGSGDYSDLFETEADWQTSVTTYGVCGKFVYSVSAISSTITISGTTMTLSGTRRATSDMDAGSLGMRYAWYVPELSGDIFTTSTSPVVGDDIWIYENGTWSTTYMGIEPKIDEVTASIRLPKITGIIEGTTDLTALGDLVQQYVKLPNIKGFTDWWSYGNGSNTPTGAFHVQLTGNGSPSAGSLPAQLLSFDASRCSSVYSGDDTDTKIQPQSIKVLYYISIATTYKTEIQVDIDEIATDLNGKADIDLSNINNSGTSLGAGWAMPSDTYTSLTIGASGSTYIAPANGWYWLGGEWANAAGYVQFSNAGGLAISSIAPFAGNGMTIHFPAKKGEIISLTYNTPINNGSIRFYYANGSESEAS